MIFGGYPQWVWGEMVDVKSFETNIQNVCLHRKNRESRGRKPGRRR